MGGAVGRAAAAACGLPPGVFSLIHGAGATVGMAMVRHPAGCRGRLHRLARGRSRALRCRGGPAASDSGVCRDEQPQSRLSPAREFCGRRGPAVAQGLLGSFTLGVGQFCTKPGLVFAQRGAETDAFLGALAAAVKAAPCASMLSASIREAFLAHRGQVQALAGVKELAAATGSPDQAKTQAQPSVSLASAADFVRTPAMATEAFGPFTLVILADSLAEFSACAQALDGQLTATVHGTPADLGRGRKPGRRTAAARRAPDHQRISHRRGGQPGHESRRPLSGDDRQPLHLGRHRRHLPLRPAGLLSGIPRRTSCLFLCEIRMPLESFG